MLKKYLITSKEFYTNNPTIFKKRVQQQFLKHLPEYALYRDKESENYALLAQDFVAVCQEFEGMKSFLHGDVALAFKLGADGVHLTSLQFDKIESAKSLGLSVIVSTHTLEEVLHAQKLGADCVTYSPIFYSPNKGEPKGVENFKKLLSQTTLKVFALGGIIEQKQIDEIAATSAYGFASIRYFY